MRTTKVSVSLPDDLLLSARALAGGNLSALVTEALRNHVLLENMRVATREHEERAGTFTDAEIDDVLARWPSRSA